MAAVLEGLRNRAGTYIDDADVNVTSFTDSSGDEVEGIVLPIAMGSTGSGSYEGIIPATAEVSSGRYRITITALHNGVQGKWTETVIVTKRVA